MVRSFIIGVLLVAGAVATFAEVVDVEAFGRCEVVTKIDDFTDEVEHHLLICAGSGLGISVACFERIGGYAVYFDVDGVFLAGDSKVTIKYRFDKDEPFVGEGITVSGFGVLVGRVHFDEVLDGIVGAESVAVQLDDKTKRLQLGDAGEGRLVSELRARCPTEG